MSAIQWMKDHAKGMSKREAVKACIRACGHSDESTARKAWKAVMGEDSNPNSTKPSRTVQWMMDNAKGMERREAVNACMRACGHSEDSTARKAWNIVFGMNGGNNKSSFMDNGNGNGNGRKKIKGAVNIDKVLKETDPMEVLFHALQDIELNQTVPDQAMYAHVRDNYLPTLTKTMWATLKNMDCYYKWQYRQGTRLINWGHPQAITKQKSVQYKYSI